MYLNGWVGVCVCVCVSCNLLCTRNWGDEAGARKRQFEVQFLTRCATLFLYTRKERQTVRAREGVQQQPQRPEGEASYRVRIIVHWSSNAVNANTTLCVLYMEG